MDSRDLDLDGALIAWQARQVTPSQFAELAARAARSEQAGPHTAAIADLVGASNDDIWASIDRNLPELLGEGGAEEISDAEALHRTVRRVAARIVNGEVRPGIGAMSIASLHSLAYRRGWEEPDEIGLFASWWEQIHPDVEPPEDLVNVVEAEILATATRLVEADE
jgi:hypothetical protein